MFLDRIGEGDDPHGVADVHAREGPVLQASGLRAIWTSSCRARGRPEQGPAQAELEVCAPSEPATFMSEVTVLSGPSGVLGRGQHRLNLDCLHQRSAFVV